MHFPGSTHAVLAAMLPFLLSGCVHTDARSESPVDITLEMCRLLSPDGVVSVADDDEAWFWFQSTRADASRRLWNRRGIRLLENRVAATPSGRDRNCLERALREARAQAIEHF